MRVAVAVRALTDLAWLVLILGGGVLGAFGGPALLAVGAIAAGTNALTC